jgi:hypothetical protein
MEKNYVGTPTNAAFLIGRSPTDPKLFNVYSVDPKGIVEYAVEVDMHFEAAVALAEKLEAGDM